MFAQALLQVFLFKLDRIGFLQIAHGFSFLHEIPRQTKPQKTDPLFIWNGLLYISLPQTLQLVLGFLLYRSLTHPVYHKSIQILISKLC